MKAKDEKAMADIIRQTDEETDAEVEEALYRLKLSGPQDLADRRLADRRLADRRLRERALIAMHGATVKEIRRALQATGHSPMYLRERKRAFLLDWAHTKLTHPDQFRSAYDSLHPKTRP